MFDLIKIVIAACIVIVFLTSCREVVDKQSSVPTPNLTVLTYLNQYQTTCSKFGNLKTKNAEYSEQLTNLENLSMQYLERGMCQHVAGNYSKAKNSFSNIVYLGEVFDVDLEAERIVFSYFRESKNELEAAWASDQILKHNYTIYGQVGYSRKLSVMKSQRTLSKFIEKIQESQ